MPVRIAATGSKIVEVPARYIQKNSFDPDPRITLEKIDPWIGSRRSLFARLPAQRRLRFEIGVAQTFAQQCS